MIYFKDQELDAYSLPLFLHPVRYRQGLLARSTVSANG